MEHDGAVDTNGDIRSLNVYLRLAIDTERIGIRRGNYKVQHY